MTTDVQTFTVGEGDDLITYDVRGDLSSRTPLFLFGSPMEASYFGTLADLIGITPANLAVLKNGRAKAVRFSTLDALCRALDCQPGDILNYQAGGSPPSPAQGS